jgi:hypothetical protein
MKTCSFLESDTVFVRFGIKLFSKCVIRKSSVSMNLAMKLFKNVLSVSPCYTIYYNKKIQLLKMTSPQDFHTHFENNLIPNLTKTVSLSRNEQVFIFN